MELTGTIKLIGETQTFGEKGFRKRELVVTTNEQYPQHIMLEFVQDKTDLLDKFKVGQEVKVGLNLRGREWISPQGETKYFNTLQGWSISLENASANSAGAHIEKGKKEPHGDIDEDDGLPFN